MLNVQTITRNHGDAALPQPDFVDTKPGFAQAAFAPLAFVASPLAPTPPLATASAAPSLKVVVQGFSNIERSLLEGMVSVSQRRTPRLEMLPASQLDTADVVMIDTRDERAMDWSRSQPALQNKAVIWVDGSSAGPGHTLTRRPVQWPILPILLARALEQGPGATPQPAPEEAGARFAAAPITAPGSAPVRAAMRPLLVVDDSLAVRNYLSSLLQARGFEVTAVTGAQAAIEAVGLASYAAVLMDVLMPGIDGYEGCKQIKARLRGAARVPVIMLTSKSSPFDRIRGKMAGCDAYLTKPVDPHQLHEVLAKHVGAPQQPVQARPALPAPAPAPAQAPTPHPIFEWRRNLAARPLNSQAPSARPAGALQC